MDTDTEGINEQPVPESVEIELSGAGMSLKRKIDMATALDVMNVVLGGAAGPAREFTGGGSVSRKQGGTNSGMSVGESITASGATKNAEKMVAIGAWLEDETGLESFTASQVREQFQKAKHRTPANWSRDWSAAVKSGWLAESTAEAGQFYVTKNTGRPALERQFAAK